MKRRKKNIWKHQQLVYLYGIQMVATGFFSHVYIFFLFVTSEREKNVSIDITRIEYFDEWLID